MSICTEAKRTLVKSPPELWSELSDTESLARHLEGLGEIRIVSTKPETAVDWEADGASGSVRLEPSGFGTKVMLSLSREAAEPPVAIEPQPQPETEPVVEAEPLAEAELEPEPAPIAAEPEPVAVEPEPRRGFFARLFGRRRKQRFEPFPAAEAAPIVEAVAASEPKPTVTEPEPVMTEPEPAPATEPQPVEEGADIAANLATLEADMVRQDEAMLTTMLDRLGAAHHRPFSRG